MSLARALTTRMRTRFEDASANPPNRAFSTRNKTTQQPFDRKLISLPVELISCSNALAYEAPDIGKITANMGIEMMTGSQPNSPLPADVTSPMSSASSTNSWDDSLASPALTSASSVTSHEDSRESSPANVDPSPMSSTFFLEKDQKDLAAKSSLRDTKQSFASRQSTATVATTATTSTTATADSEPPVPEIPKRSLTHTKRTHQALARQRSMSRVSETRVAEPAARSSTDDPAAPPKLEADHPFGAELEQVNELVEELKTSVAAEPEVHILDEESQALIDEGFGRFSAADYIVEIQPLFCKAFGEASLPIIQEWI